jgi:hypothetical protein
MELNMESTELELRKGQRDVVDGIIRYLSRWEIRNYEKIRRLQAQNAALAVAMGQYMDTRQLIR